ncbi:MAG: hypothetical protein JO061_08640 [Acidobacteriaceae bacterium]|nr:hypothetical protein [Acidobacteriaceae bacterium]
MTRRDWLALAGLAFPTSCGRKKGTGYPGYALIATAGDNSVAVVDLTRFRYVKSIPVPAPPTAVVSASAAVAYVLTPSNGSVSIIDAGLNRRITRRWADELSEIRLLPNEKRLIGVAPSSRELIEADARTVSVTRRRRLGSRPTTLDISSQGHVAVASRMDGSVDLFDLSTGEWRHIRLKPGIGAVRFRADGKVLLVADTDQRLITGLSIPDLGMIAELPLAMSPENLCFKPDGGQLFVSGNGMDAVAIVFPYNDLEVEQTVLAGRDPGAMACSADPTYLFVASASGSDVNILNVDNRKVIGVVQVGLEPRFIMTTPDDQYALVLNERSGDIAVIRVGAIRANRDRTGAALFTMLPVGNRPVHCAILPRQLG